MASYPTVRSRHRSLFSSCCAKPAQIQSWCSERYGASPLMKHASRTDAYRRPRLGVPLKFPRLAAKLQLLAQSAVCRVDRLR
jgi:hypothetical protein